MICITCLTKVIELRNFVHVQAKIMQKFDFIYIHNMYNVANESRIVTHFKFLVKLTWGLSAGETP